MKKLLKITLSLLMVFNLSVVSAWTIDYFKVDFNKDSSWVWEALDLTITALDKNDEVVTDYTGNVFGFSETDDEVELPEELSHDEWYSFKLSDQWVKKFENWIKFNNTWEQSISLYDADDYENVTWKWEINIIKSDNKEKKVKIEIITPESNTTLPENKLKVSGSTTKNHQVRITLNNKEDFITTSNTDWIFEKEVEWLNTWQNLIKAFTIDADENIIWESNEVIINIDDSKPKFKKIILSPLSESGSVEENTNIEVKVFANVWLKSVKLLFNDWVIELSETEKWVYTWWFKTPWEEKVFPIDVIMTDELWHTTTEKKAIEIDVFLVETNSAEEKIVTWIEIEEVDVEEDAPNLKIEWLKLVKLKSKSILSWKKLEDAKSYDVFKKNESSWDFEFLKNVVDPKFEIEITWEDIKYQYFAVKAKTETSSWEVITWSLSEATKIQTWPTEIVLILLLSLVLWFFFMIVRRKRA